MRIRLNTLRPPASGSVLIVTLIIALVLGMSLTSYLLLVRAQSVSVARSQAWHASMTAAEAGVEEALAQLNLTPLATNLTLASAWQPMIGGYRLNQSRKLAVSPPLSESWYIVFLKSSIPPGPIITICATGYATVPTISTTLKRSLEVTVTNSTLFSAGMVTKGAIGMNGKNLTTDSFDSTNPYRSTSGRYDRSKVTSPRDWHGDVASGLGVRDFGTLDVNGDLSLGLAATNKTSRVFTISGNMTRDFNADLPDVPLPFTPGSASAPKSGTAGGTNYTYVLKRDQNYQVSSLNGSLFVTNDANAVLYVTGNAALSSVIIGPRASVKLYIGGASASIGALSSSGSCTNFQVYGLRTNLTLTLPPVGTFVGTIYAPGAKVSTAGTGTNTLDFQGAVVADSLDLRSNFKLHFDESLKNQPPAVPRRGFIVTSWKEVQ